jgi:L-amino acid N-acyltransferase YncA
MNALKGFPKSVAGRYILRPMVESDQPALLEFFRRIPVDERQLFKDDITRVSVLEGWIRNLNYLNILPLLAFESSRIVADITLHRDRRGWARHVAKVRLTLDPDYRRRGLARGLILEMIALSKGLNIAILQAEILDVQREARLLFEDLGFQCVATLPQHAIDLAGRVHDILVYAQTITSPESLAPEASLTEAEADVGGG